MPEASTSLRERPSKGRSKAKQDYKMYHRNLAEMAENKKSYQQLEKAGLNDNEALIIVAQQHVLRARFVQALPH